jgi:hypothetical protein
MENFEKTWKPTSKELEVKKLGTEQEKKELKIGTLIIPRKENA